MRKIKLLTLLTLMLGSIVTTQAQEKQNDATWEETIDFLKKNIHHLECWSRYFGVTQSTYDCSVEMVYGYVTQGYENSDDFLCNTTFPLDKLKMISSFEETTFGGIVIKIELTGSYLIKKCSDNRGERRYSVTGFRVDDKEEGARILKAFKHLAYLATEKRKKEHEASGDKF